MVGVGGGGSWWWWAAAVLSQRGGEAFSMRNDRFSESLGFGFIYLIKWTACQSSPELMFGTILT